MLRWRKFLVTDILIYPLIFIKTYFRWFNAHAPTMCRVFCDEYLHRGMLVCSYWCPKKIVEWQVSDLFLRYSWSYRLRYRQHRTRSVLMAFIWITTIVLQWYQNERDGVSFVCSTICSGTDQRKHHSSASQASVRGIHRWPVDSPHKVTRKMFPFYNVITCLVNWLQLIGSKFYLTGSVNELYWLEKKWR